MCYPALKAGFCCSLSFNLSAPGLLLGPQLALTWYVLLIDSPGDLQATVGWFPVSVRRRRAGTEAVPRARPASRVGSVPPASSLTPDTGEGGF